MSLGDTVHVPSGPHQGVPVVFGYTYGHVKSVHLMYIGVHEYKYIGHETANWFGVWRTSIGVLSEMWGGDRRITRSVSDCHETIVISVRRDRVPTLHWI